MGTHWAGSAMRPSARRAESIRSHQRVGQGFLRLFGSIRLWATRVVSPYAAFLSAIQHDLTDRPYCSRIQAAIRLYVILMPRYTTAPIYQPPISRSALAGDGARSSHQSGVVWHL